MLVLDYMHDVRFDKVLVGQRNPLHTISLPQRCQIGIAHSMKDRGNKTFDPYRMTDKAG